MGFHGRGWQCGSWRVPKRKGGRRREEGREGREAMVVILSGDDDGWYYVVISRYILVDIYRIYAYRELSYRF